MRKLLVVRRLSQLCFLGLFIYILWSTTYPLKGILPSGIFFKFDPLIMILTSISERLLLSGIIFSILMLGLTAIWGRFFCGWVCPLGTVIDIAGVFGKPKVLSDVQNQKARKLKFLILGIITILAICSIQAAWILDPLVIIARFISLNLIPALTGMIDGLFSWMIRIFHLYGPVYDLYRSLKSSLLGVKIYYFSHSLIIFSLFLAIFIAAMKLKRSWCRVVCPLGALYALFSKTALFKRSVEKCVNCGMCRPECRMGAIKEDISYVKSECVLCMDCVYSCPANVTRFSFVKPKLEEKSGGITRRQFLALGFVSAMAAVSGCKDEVLASRPKRQRVVRPPAALKEEEFLDRCIRCGNCMKVCITNGLQPALFQAGLSGIWTPQLVPEIGYCEYHCTLCGNVCPTGALPKLSLEEKLKTRLGLARIDRKLCLPWKKGKDCKECIVCEEHCPIGNKAIKLKKVNVDGKIVSRPYINERLCIGCGICQTKCPARPERAIKVYPVMVDHGNSNKENIK